MDQNFFIFSMSLLRVQQWSQCQGLPILKTFHLKVGQFCSQQRGQHQHQCQGYPTYVADCPSQLIRTCFICSMTKLNEHSREICWGNPIFEDYITSTSRLFERKKTLRITLFSLSLFIKWPWSKLPLSL